MTDTHVPPTGSRYPLAGWAAADELSKARDQISNLETALNSSRVIGMAVGVVMERCRLSDEEAFALLIRISQHTHRKLRDIAADLVYTGLIPDA